MKISSVFIALILFQSALFAAPVNEEQVRKAAESFLITRFPESNPAKARISTKLGNSRLELKGVAALTKDKATIGYVVTLQPEGFLLVRADDEVAPLKLYSDTGEFTNLPPQFLEVIKLELAEELSSLRNAKSESSAVRMRQNQTNWAALVNPGTNTLSIKDFQTGAAGSALLTTTWHQDDPYNYYSPAANGGPGGRAYAGCTACALSQILRYHLSPAQVTRDHSYTDNAGSCTGTHSINEAGLGAYDWNAMPANVTTSSPMNERQAVGQLMHHAAVALESDFEAGGTSASPSDIPNVLSTYFGYQSGAYENKSSFSSAQWYAKIATDIGASRPIFYAFWQADYSAGHAVVCDGYRNGNEIHLNLGWSGSGNLWYNIDTVSYGYTWTIHAAVFGITAPAGSFLPPQLNAEPDITAGTENTIRWTAGASELSPVTAPASQATGEQSQTRTDSRATQGGAGAPAETGQHALAGVGNNNAASNPTMAGTNLPQVASSPTVIARLPATEQYFDPGDHRSDGVLILSVAPATAAPNSGTQDGGPRTGASDYRWWDWSGSLAIPDNNTSWGTGINCDPPAGVPSGAVVTRVRVHHEITHTYIGDLECKLYNSTHTWMIRDNAGGSTDNVNETLDEYGTFAGDSPAQSWYYRVRDITGGDTGTLTRMQLYVYFDLPSADLTAYKPSNWNDKIPVGTSQLTWDAAHSYSGTYYDNQPLYFNWGSLNQGSGAASGYTVHFEVTGTGGGSWNWSSLSTDPTYWTHLLTDQTVGPLAAGSHTFRMWVDYNNNVDEGGNEANNYYERTITVLPSTKPDLTSYKAANWNDKIPISITQLTWDAAHNYSGNYDDTQTLYFNWGSLNQGSATASGYTVHFEVTGTGGGSWNWSSLTTDPAYWMHLLTDQPVGPLAAGSHTFKVWVDYNNNVDEGGNEGNNYYERTITVGSSSKPDLTAYKPSNWNDKIPIGTSQLAWDAAHGYSGAYDDNQTLYFNWGGLNQGNPSASGYTVHFEVTGTGGGSWDWSGLSTDPSYWTHLLSDQAVGPLAAGNHTFKFWVDYNNNVDEGSNEANNYYERTISVSTVAPMEYYAECSDNSSFTSPRNSGWIQQIQYAFSILTPGQTYWYRVKARQGAENSGWSNVEHSQQEPVVAIAVGPASQNFGNIQIGTMADRRFYVTNTGGGTLTGSASVATPFSILSGGSYSLTANQSQAVVVHYSPTAAGSTNMSVFFTGGGSAMASVSGSALTAPDQLTGMSLSNGMFRFVLNGPVGSNFVIQASSNLVNWSPISTNTIPASGWIFITDPSITDQPRRFYRAVLQSPAGPIAIPATSGVVTAPFISVRDIRPNPAASDGAGVR